MKRYSAPLGRCAELVHDAPERTARRNGHGLFGDVVFQVWPSRAAMLTTCDMQRKGPPSPEHWTPLVKPSTW